MNVNAKTKLDIWGELKSESCAMSAKTMQTILDFLNKIWWAPELARMYGFGRSEATQLGARIATDLWPLYFGDRQGAVQPADPDEMILAISKKLKEELDCACLANEAQCSFGFITAMGCVCDQPAALNAFRRHVETRDLIVKPAVVSTVEDREITGNLSSNQKAAFDFCVQTGNLFYSKFRPLAGFKIRSFPLIAGPTGAGKSHLVREVAQSLGCHYVPLDYGTWSPQGGKQEPNTLEFLASKVLQHERILLHIDELDKLRGGFSSSWDISVLNEIWKVLDRPIDVSTLPSAQSYEGGEQAFAKLFCERVWIVGSGTWQEIFGAPTRAIGFAAGEAMIDQNEATKDKIHKSELIPPELLGRFNSSIQILNYPEVAEIVDLLERAGLKLDQAGQDRLTKNLGRSGFRAVEDLVTKYSIQCLNAQQNVIVKQAEPESEREGPTVAEMQKVTGSVAACFKDRGANVYWVKPPQWRSAAPVRMKQLPGMQVQLQWLHERCGKDFKGGVTKYERIPHLEIWDDFADKWGLDRLQVVSLEVFETWNPELRKLPASNRISDSNEDCYNFWLDHIGRDGQYEEELKRAVSEIHANISPESRRTELKEERFKISAALLYGGTYQQITEPDYVGPNLTELRLQCERYVDEGLYFLHNQTDLSGGWTAALQNCFEDWEQRLVACVVEGAQGTDLICEILQIPEGMGVFFNRLKSNSSWSDLSEEQRQGFNNALEVCYPQVEG